MPRLFRSIMASGLFKYKVLVSFLATLIVWGVFSWPLPRHVFTGIPASAHNVEQHNTRRMLAGDHLQFHYFYWLFSDMLAGGTPFWHNLYEFNTGDDSARRQIGNYNMPIVFVYAAARRLGSNAFAWNLTGFLTLWGTLVATWLLIRRYTHEDRFSLIFALLSIGIPYRWIPLLGGSPTGFAILWVPLLFLGLDMAGRDDSVKGSLLAGLALLLSYWNDPHTFFFSVLIVPVAYLAAFLRRERFPRQTRHGWLRVIGGIAPVALLIVSLIVKGMAEKSATFAGTTMEAGRSLQEVLLFTPRLRGIFGWQANPTDVQIFIGYALLVYFGIHLAMLPLLVRRKPSGGGIRHVLLVLLLYASVCGVAMLAMGPHGPVSGILFRAARKFLPGYEMIRQTAKVYALMPPLLAVAAAVAGLDLMRLTRQKTVKWAICALPVLLACAEAHRVIAPTVCLLDRSQDAYEAVHRDARHDPDVTHAHALAIPLWPGDSHWASLYQHYASLYRIRMLNGYSPVVHEGYRDLASRRLGGVNGGLIEAEQFDLLLDMGIRYIIFHEDAFPEQISGYPAFLTLRRLLEDPRLALLAQDGSIWSFRMRTTADPTPTRLPDGPYFPSRRWNASVTGREGGANVPDPNAWGGTYARIAEGEQLPTLEFNHMFAPDPRLWIRIRGHGVCRFERTANDPNPVMHHPKSDEWTWLPLPLPSARQDMRISAKTLEGVVEIDMMTLIAGGWSLPEPGETVSLPGCLFFRSGFTDSRDNSANLRPDYDAASNVFYGPRLPFPEGVYDITFRFASGAPSGTRLGTLVLPASAEEVATVPVVAGTPAKLAYRHRTNLPVEIRFIYARNDAISIQSVDFTFVSTRHNGR